MTAVNAEDLDLDDDRITSAIAEAIVRSEELDAKRIVDVWDAYDRGRADGLLERPHRPERHEAETRRKLRDLALAREVKRMEADPDAVHPVRRLRLAKNLGQRDLATLAGVSTRAVTYVEAGGKAQFRTIAALASVLGVASKDLGIEVRP